MRTIAAPHLRQARPVRNHLLPRKPRRLKAHPHRWVKITDWVKRLIPIGRWVYRPRCTTVLDRRPGHKERCWNFLPLDQHIGPCATCREILDARP